MAGGVLALASPAQAVTFQIATATLSGGTGYGSDSGSNAENGGTLLNVLFNTTFLAQAFTLNAINDYSTFAVGTVTFDEPDTGSGANHGIRNQEQDNLGVVASFNFTSPSGISQALTAVGTAIVGAIADSPEAVDYMLTWTPVPVNFGLGGVFQIDLSDLSFSNVGTQTQTATITLLALPREETLSPTPTVPEPATLALFGLGLAGIGVMRRKKLAA